MELLLHKGEMMTNIKGICAQIAFQKGVLKGGQMELLVHKR